MMKYFRGTLIILQLTVIHELCNKESFKEMHISYSILLSLSKKCTTF